MIAVVAGRGEKDGRELTSNPIVSKLTFTGKNRGTHSRGGREHRRITLERTTRRAEASYSGRFSNYHAGRSG
jgi:acyl-CoA reductase-like NAD-dependent aldehyde dehydrogenase